MVLPAIIKRMFKKKKIISELRGYHSVFDYLLYEQKSE